MSTYTNHTNRAKRLTALALILLLPLALTLSGCDQQLEQEPFSQITPQNFFKNQQEFLAAATGVYAQLRVFQYGPLDVPEHTSDEMMVPTRGPNWGDGGVWRDLTQHEWTSEHPDFNEVWGIMQTGIARANGILTSLASSQGLSEAQKAEFAAEIRFLRAYYYYHLMDSFGGVPIVVEEGNQTYDFPQQPPSPQDPPPHHSRKTVYDFILQELTGCTSGNFDDSCVNSPSSNSVLANLQSKGAVEYGRATKGAGYAFLARLLLNSEVFAVDVGGQGSAGPGDVGTGPALYQEALTAANTVINGQNGVGMYSLADDYFKNFAADNHTSPEMIFAVTYKSGEQGLGLQSVHKSALHYNLPNPGGTPWNGFTTIAEFYESYETNPGADGEIGTRDDEHLDTRGKTFLLGQQYAAPTSGCAGDDCFSDTSADSLRMDNPTASPVNFTLEIPNIELGNLTASQAQTIGFPDTAETYRLDAPGARPLKYELDPGTSNEFFGNDLVIFRLAEMYLIRAEAQWKTGTGDPISTLETLRQRRFKASADYTLSGGDVIEKIMRERGHELYQEMVRRQDLIRYEFAHGGTPSGYEQAPDPSGVYSPTWTGPWLFKEASEDFRVLFPIPETQLSTNPNLKQNSGY